MTKISHDSETPAEGKQVVTACAFIHSKINGVTKVFLPKRALTKKFLPGVYELPGGHVDFGEDPVEGLKREIKEELGVTIHVGDPFAAFAYVNKIKGSHSFEIAYFAEFADPLENIQINPEDHSKFEWFAENELDRVIEENGKNKRPDDPEIEIIKKGFNLLKGNSLKFK